MNMMLVQQNQNSKLEWADTNTLLSKDEIAEYNANLYKVQREAEYPSLAQQMDMQYHDLINGTTVWKDTIEAIKAKYPKP